MSDHFRIQVPIAMLGATGVGKTSMLAAMWNEFQRVADDANLQLIPDEETQMWLSDRLAELQAVAGGPPGMPMPETSQPGAGAAGIKGTSLATDYRFDFFHTVSRASFEVVFRDYPGGWVHDVQKLEEVRQKLADAKIILLAIDVPALMAPDPSLHERFNRPTDLTSTLCRALRSGPEDLERLVLVVFMRGERWLREGEGAAVLAQFEKRCAGLLRVLRGYSSSVGVALCPIQTLGAVRFVQHNERGVPAFEKIPGETYAPVDCDQPLRYAMAYITRELHRYASHKETHARQAIHNRSSVEKVRDGLFRWAFRVFSLGGTAWTSEKERKLDDWMQRSAALRKSIETYARGCKRGSPFSVLQPAAILEA